MQYHTQRLVLDMVKYNTKEAILQNLCEDYGRRDGRAARWEKQYASICHS